MLRCLHYADRLPRRTKSIAQSLIPITSRGLAWQKTDTLLCAIVAYLDGVRGLGWSPALELEAISATRWINPDEDFVVMDAGASIGSWITTFHKKMGNKGRIYAFEPQPEASAKIRELK